MSNGITVACSIASAIIVAISNVWIAKSTHATEAKKSEKEIMVASYKSQLESADTRGDSIEVQRLRIAYEKFEEAWRAEQFLLSATSAIKEDLEVTLVQKEQIENSLSEVEENSGGQFDPFSLGSAYLVRGDYVNAANYLSEIADSSNPNVDVLLSLAYKGQTQSADTDSAKKAFMRRYIEFHDRAKSKGADTTKIDKLSSNLGLNK